MMTVIKKEINRLYIRLRYKRISRAMNRTIEELRRLVLATRSASIALRDFEARAVIHITKELKR